MKRPRFNHISYSLDPRVVKWLEEHTGQPTLVGEGAERHLNPSRGWSWAGAVYDNRGGYIDFEPRYRRVAMLFKLAWGAYDSINQCSS